MFNPKGESFVKHTKTLTKRVSPRSQLHPPLKGALGVTVFFGFFSSDARRNERTVRGEQSLLWLSRAVRELDCYQMNKPFCFFKKEKTISQSPSPDTLQGLFLP